MENFQFVAACICDTAQITVDRGTVAAAACLNGQTAQITCNVAGAKLFQTTVDSTARFLSNQNAYDYGTAPTCNNGVWETQTVFKCRGTYNIRNVAKFESF